MSSEIIELAIGTTLTGLTVVFIVLVFLMIVVSIIGAIGVKVSNSQANKTTAAPSQGTPVVTTTKHQLDESTVAAITGAVACMVEGNFKISSIKLQGTSDNIWES